MVTREHILEYRQKNKNSNNNYNNLNNDNNYNSKIAVTIIIKWR